MKMKHYFLFLVVLLATTVVEIRAQDAASNSTASSNSSSSVSPSPVANSTSAISTTGTTSTTTAITTTTTTTSTTTTATTTTVNPCSVNSPFCNSNGNCSIDAQTSQQKCTCRENYYGSRCELVACTKEEDPKQCLNGICLKHIQTKVLSCQCQSDYTGANCEKPLCIDLCYNNGVCEYDSTNKTRVCRCLDRFYGERCEFDGCTEEVKTCAKGCYMYKVQSQCKCACSDECNQAFCFSNGACELKNENLACKCKVGFSGPQCRTDDCKGFCFNNGTCFKNETDSVTCRCLDSYTGKHCETINNTPSKARRSTAGRVFLYILVLSLIVCTVGLTAYAYKRGGLDYVREKFDNLTYRLRSSYEPASTHGRSNIPYVQTHNKPEDSYTDPFS